MSLSRAEYAVRALIANGVPLDEIEHRIDDMALDAERRSALWLLAWADSARHGPRGGRFARPSTAGE